MLETCLELRVLEDLGDGVFTNVRPLYQPEGARGIYGGCVSSYLVVLLMGHVLTTFEGHRAMSGCSTKDTSGRHENPQHALLLHPRRKSFDPRNIPC